MALAALAGHGAPPKPSLQPKKLAQAGEANKTGAVDQLSVNNMLL